MTATRPGGRAIDLVSLWFALLGGTVAWAARLLLAYALVGFACRTGWIALLHLITLTAALVAIAAIVIAWRGWQATKVGTRVEIGGAVGRGGFLALLSILINLIMLLAILLEGTAVFVIDPCAAGP